MCIRDRCLPMWKHPNLESQERYYCRKAHDLSPALHKLVYEVLCTDDPLAIRRVRGILSVAKKYTSDTLEEAARSALGITPLRFTRFKGLCEKYAESPRATTSVLTQSHELIRSLDEYETLIAERTSV
jgi:hypothetical protein